MTAYNLQQVKIVLITQIKLVFGSSKNHLNTILSIQNYFSRSFILFFKNAFSFSKDSKYLSKDFDFNSI